MHAGKWLSNSERVLEKTPEGDRAAEVDFDKGNLPSVKTLGELWLAKEDVFNYRGSPPEDDYPLTKRNFLRFYAIPSYEISADTSSRDMDLWIGLG